MDFTWFCICIILSIVVIELILIKDTLDKIKDEIRHNNKK